jgi:hypothetical protein
MLNLDLSQVKESGPSIVPTGSYDVVCDDAVVKDTKSGGGQYINAKFRIVGGEYDGRTLFNMFNIANQNPKAVEIGLSQLKSFMKAAGVTDLKLNSVLDLVGLRALAVVKVKTDDFGEKSTISYFKPLSKDSKSQDDVIKETGLF